MQPDDETLEQPSEQEQSGEAHTETAEAVPELVPGRHVVRVWNADTGKAVEVKRSIDTGNTLDLWI
jgi:hypothetical protein